MQNEMQNINNVEQTDTANTAITAENNKLKQKEYNKQYYAKNKGKILSQLSRKVKCPNCDRQVSFCNYTRHQTNSICKKYKELNKLMVKVE